MSIVYGTQPVSRKRTKLQLRWVVFVDQDGNLAVYEMERDRPLGSPAAARRPPTVYLLSTDDELDVALEQMLHEYRTQTKVTTKHLSLVAQVEEARARHHGWRKEAA